MSGTGRMVKYYRTAHLNEPRIRQPTQVAPATTTTRKPRPPVRSSEYFRAQARLHRDIAQLLTDPIATEQALTTAADYLDRADDMERAERHAERFVARKQA
jgi:hypothetical protein